MTTLLLQTTTMNPCADCRQAPATRTFLHMTKGHFPLCEYCFTWADHDDDYLDLCTCDPPTGKPGAIVCKDCERMVVRCSCLYPNTLSLYVQTQLVHYHRCLDCEGYADRFFEHKTRFDRFHEELMAKAWHPSRVSRWLDHGEEVLDMMMGVD